MFALRDSAPVGSCVGSFHVVMVADTKGRDIASTDVLAAISTVESG
jgi:hypothetical protein